MVGALKAAGESDSAGNSVAASNQACLAGVPAALSSSRHFVYASPRPTSRVRAHAKHAGNQKNSTFILSATIIDSYATGCHRRHDITPLETRIRRRGLKLASKDSRLSPDSTIGQLSH